LVRQRIFVTAHGQTRGGCVCAGPYGLQLLGVSPENAARFEDELKRGRNETMRPGFVRLSLPFFASPAEVDYCVEAIRQVRRFAYLQLEFMHSTFPLWTFVITDFSEDYRRAGAKSGVTITGNNNTIGCGEGLAAVARVRLPKHRGVAP
jgi:hypothetical protein